MRGRAPGSKARPTRLREALPLSVGVGAGRRGKGPGPWPPPRPAAGAGPDSVELSSARRAAGRELLSLPKAAAICTR